MMNSMTHLIMNLMNMINNLNMIIVDYLNTILTKLMFCNGGNGNNNNTPDDNIPDINNNNTSNKKSSDKNSIDTDPNDSPNVIYLPAKMPILPKREDSENKKKNKNNKKKNNKNKKKPSNYSRFYPMINKLWQTMIYLTKNIINKINMTQYSWYNMIRGKQIPYDPNVIYLPAKMPILPKRENSENKNNYSPFYSITPSPWPLMMSLSIMNMLFNLTMMFYYQKNLNITMLINVMMCLYLWFRDIIRESLYQGNHTKLIQKSLKMGMIMFIGSEIFLFFSLFWMLLNTSYLPTLEMGMMWPPKSISPFNPIGMPLLNSVILLTSGFFITWSHHSLMMKDLNNSIKSLTMTIMCGILFSLIQMFEYSSAPFTMTDSTYGSAFFMITGFHGIHVMVGCMMLTTSLIRMMKNQFSSIHHFNFEASAWYWHFVDVVWIMVFILLYIY